jgi:hypothetical protein
LLLDAELTVATGMTGDDVHAAFTWKSIAGVEMGVKMGSEKAGTAKKSIN